MIEHSSISNFGYVYEPGTYYREYTMARVEHTLSLYNSKVIVNHHFDHFSEVTLKLMLNDSESFRKGVNFFVILDPDNYRTFKAILNSFIEENQLDSSLFNIYFFGLQPIDQLFTDDQFFENSYLISYFFVDEIFHPDLGTIKEKYPEFFGEYDQRRDFYGNFYIIFKILKPAWLHVNLDNTKSFLQYLYSDTARDAYSSSLLENNNIPFFSVISRIQNNTLIPVERINQNELYQYEWFYGTPQYKICNLSLSNELSDQKHMDLIILNYLSGKYSKFDTWIYHTLLASMNEINRNVKKLYYLKDIFRNQRAVPYIINADRHSSDEAIKMVKIINFDQDHRFL